MAAVLDDTLHSDGRTLFTAIACSVALHLALLYLLPALFEATRRAAPWPKTLTARLAAPRPPEPPRVVEEPTLAPPARTPKVVRPAPHKPAPRAREPVAPPVIAVTPALGAPAAVVPAPAPAPALPPVAAAPAAALAPAASTVPDPGSVAQFRMELIELAGHYKRYPRAAVDNNWEGKVDLRMVVAANGSIASLLVRKSAGYAALDDEAQRMFRSAKGQLAVPPALRGKEFTVDVSADFYFLKE